MVVVLLLLCVEIGCFIYETVARGVVEVTSPAMSAVRKVFCYPRILGTPSPRLPTINVSSGKDIMSIKYKEETMSVNPHYFYKLVSPSPVTRRAQRC